MRNIEEEIQERPAKRKRLSRKESRRRFERRVFRNFEHVLDFDRVDALPPHIPNYYSINAPPSKLPPRHFCYVCGFVWPNGCASTKFLYLLTSLFLLTVGPLATMFVRGVGYGSAG